MIDNGRKDSKVIAIPFSDPSYNGYKDVSELPKHISLEMTHFFSVYKELEKIETVVTEVEGHEKAILTISKEIDNYIEKFCR
jgi:inorganic pyrophosphatase